MNTQRVLKTIFLVLVALIFQSIILAQTTVDGYWVGGTNVAGRPMFIQSRFATDGTASIDIPSLNAMRLPILNVSRTQANVEFKIDSPYGVFDFVGKTSDGVIAGNISAANGMKGELHLVRAAKINRKSFDEYAGSYRGPNNQIFYLTYNPFDQLSVVVTETAANVENVGRVVTLIPSSEKVFFTSRSAIAPPSDKDEEVTFLRNASGAVTGFEWAQPDGKKVSAQKFEEPYRQESVSFVNGEIRLGGALFLPRTEGKHPAMVVGHGGGPTTRDNVALFLRARQFVMMGYAVLLYDKRGTGDATGAPWSSATFDDLAGDMLAAVALLKKHPDIDAKKIGLQGNSQAGWVIPLAAVASNDVRFVIIASGGGITNSDTDIHEARYYIQESKLPAADADELLNYVKAKWNYALTETGWDAYEIALKKAQGKTWLLNFGGPAVKDPKAWRKIGLHKDKDLEAEKTIAQIKVPILLLYGEPALDEHMPVIDSIKGWENAFKMSGNKDHEIKKLSGVGHSVFLAIANGKSVINQEAFTAVKDWLAVHLKPLQ